MSLRTAFAVALVTSAVAVPAADARVVLGASDYVNGGVGWGTAHPKRIFNGGAPSGEVSGIRWRGWGNAVAKGRGKTPLYRPEGGYYRKRGRADLRAKKIGTCPGSSDRAYLVLYLRVAEYPGGPMGKWFKWSGDDNLCEYG